MTQKTCASCAYWSDHYKTRSGMSECYGVEYENEAPPDNLSDTFSVPVIFYDMLDGSGLHLSYFTPPSHSCALHKEKQND